LAKESLNVTLFVKRVINVNSIFTSIQNTELIAQKATDEKYGCKYGICSKWPVSYFLDTTKYTNIKKHF
jgi:hypothetical protein